MRTGFDNKRNVAILGSLGLVLVVAIVYFVITTFGGGSSTPAAPAAKATSTEPATAAGRAQEGSARTSEVERTNAEATAENGRPAKKVFSLASLDPTLHPELMASAESLVYAGSGRNIFSMSSAPIKIDQPIGPVRPSDQAQIAQTGPPPPPAIDLTFFGYAAGGGGGARRAFLLHGEDVFIASEGDVVDHHYKVLKISPLSIQVTDLLYNNTQTLPLSQS
jgi:hypothetical protein